MIVRIKLGQLGQIKSLLAKGLRGRVRDCTYLFVFSDTWIPRPKFFKLVSHIQHLESHVSDFIAKQLEYE